MSGAWKRGVLGGNALRGFEFGLGGSLALSGYIAVTNGTPDFGWGEDREPTINPEDCGIPGASCYNLDENGHVPADFQDMNLFGNDQGGTACFAQSQLCSRIADKIPGFQGISLLHDTIVGDSVSQFWNFGTMLPAAAWTYASFIGQWGVPVTMMRPFYNQRGGAY